MNDINEKAPVAYGIDAIVDKIIEDTITHEKYKSIPDKQGLYSKRKKDIFTHNNEYILQLLDVSFINSFTETGQFEKAGWLPPELIIADERIRDMCRNLTIRFNDKRVGHRYGTCLFYNKSFSCPPLSPSSQNAREQLNKANIFIAFQTKHLSLDERDGKIKEDAQLAFKKFRKEIEKTRGADALIGLWGSGNCILCGQDSCPPEINSCINQKNRLCSLESAGIAVGHLCKEIAFFTQDESWNLTYIKHYGTSYQTGDRFKKVFGLALRI